MHEPTTRRHKETRLTGDFKNQLKTHDISVGNKIVRLISHLVGTVQIYLKSDPSKLTSSFHQAITY